MHNVIQQSDQSLCGAVGSVSDLLSVDVCTAWIKTPSKAPVFPLSNNLYPHCSVLVGAWGTDLSMIYI